MPGVRVGPLPENLVMQLDKILGELAKTANDQRTIPPQNAVRLHFSVNRAAVVSGVQVLGVRLKVPLDVFNPYFNRDGLFSGYVGTLGRNYNRNVSARALIRVD